MIFVNTSLDVALERNAERDRSVPDLIAIKSWKDVQSNIGKFSQYFRANCVVVDNNDATEDAVRSSLQANQRDYSRRRSETLLHISGFSMEMKRRGITKKPKGF